MADKETKHDEAEHRKDAAEARHDKDKNKKEHHDSEKHHDKETKHDEKEHQKDAKEARHDKKEDEIDYKEYYRKNEHHKRVENLIKGDDHGAYHHIVHKALENSEDPDKDYAELMDGYHRHTREHADRERRHRISRPQHQKSDAERYEAIKKEAMGK